MRRMLGAALAAVFVLAVPAGVAGAPRYARVEVAAGIDHGPWDRLLRKYVDERGLVDYAAWKASAADREELSAYLARMASAGEPARGNARAAALINAYNALTIAWMLEPYPIASIRSTSKAFEARRHEVGGRRVSLDDIEHGSLRPEYGYRVHAAISCASRSCPPLSARAWEAAGLDERLDAAMGSWLAREDLNRLSPGRDEVEVSMIFKWFAEDFEKAGGVRAVLARFGPEPDRSFLSGNGYKIGYRHYDWGLNDQGPEGRDYGGLRSLWDSLSR